MVQKDSGYGVVVLKAAAGILTRVMQNLIGVYEGTIWEERRGEGMNPRGVANNVIEEERGPDEARD